MQNDKHYYIGIMSGTSLDGIDVAITDCQPPNMRLLASQCYPIPDDLKTQLLQICTNKTVTLAQLGEVDHRLGILYADCVLSLLKQVNLTSDQIQAIGCHGQTIYHAPNGNYPFTLQIGDANIVAVRTGITTIADFRRKDIALGGQGAPLVPAFHQAMFTSPDCNRVILNLGGIANISVLFPQQPIIGYDTGPANVLLDSWISYQHNLSYDPDATWAKQGQSHPILLAKLLDDPYFKLPYPKSTGRELFNLQWLQNKLQAMAIAPEDIQATLIDLTVHSIVDQLKQLTPTGTLPCELLICGGGAKNPLIMNGLATQLSDWDVTTTNSYGIDADYVEAMAFAWLAHQRLYGLPANLPSVTGAKHPASLGAIYPAMSDKEHYNDR
jgi:anhydro-N-acetylmuramic acid kinase